MQESLQAPVARRALRREALQVAVAPDDAAGEQHRAAGAVALLQQRTSAPSSRALGRRGQAGHPGAGDHQVGHAQLGKGEGRLVLDVLDHDLLGVRA